MNRRVLSIVAIPFLLFGMAANIPGAALAAPRQNVSYSGRHTWTVNPLGRSPDDAAAIQQAVNMAAAGDRVMLGAGVFDFGDFDNVTVAKDLTIEGAWDRANKQPLTTIKGGYMPFLIGRKTPVEKPETVMVNGHSVYRITPDTDGKFFFPFLYPPYFVNGQQTGVHYNIFDDWVAVNVSVRQIAFLWPRGAAIMSSGSRGGTFEGCHIVSGWPFQVAIEGILAPLGSGIMFLNMGGRPSLTAQVGVLEDPTLYVGTDLITGDIRVQDNVMEGNYGEVQAGSADADGHVIALPFADNPAPPEGDYASYVLQDVPTDPTPFNLYPAQSPPVYWVRKGYTAGWFPWLNQGQGQAWARRGHIYAIYSLFSEATLTVRDNTIHNAPWSVFLIMNGMTGKPFNAIVKHNHITNHIQSVTDVGTQGVSAFEWSFTYANSGTLITPDPGTNITVKDNAIDQSYPGGWFGLLGIDIEVFGQARVTENTVKVNGGSGIGFWWPTQEGVAKNNRISGSGDYAFYTLPGSNGNLIVNNHVEGFTPTGGGAFDFGLGNPAAPAARGALFSDENVVKGVGPVDALDEVYDCGQNNLILRMTALPCPASVVAVSPRTAQDVAGAPARAPQRWPERPLMQPHKP